MPEIKHAVGVPAGKAGTINHIGAMIFHRREQPWIIPRIIFEVGVLHQHDVTGRRSKTGPQRRALPSISIMQDSLDSVIGGERLYQFPATVGGAVVHQNNLGRHRHVLHTRHNLGKRANFVIHRNNNADDHAGRSRRNFDWYFAIKPTLLESQQCHCVRAKCARRHSAGLVAHLC